MNLARVLRAGIAILFVIVLAIIVRHFAVRSISEFKIPLKTEKIDPNKIEKKEKVVHFEIKGDKKIVQVEADKHYVGEDGKRLVVVLCAGRKKSQTQDIRNAQRYWKDYKENRL